MPRPLSPQINWSNPLTRGLVFCEPIFERDGTTVKELISNTSVTITNKLAGAWVKRPQGVMLEGDVTNNGQYISTLMIPQARNLAQQTWSFFTIRKGNGGALTTNSYFRESDLTTTGMSFTDNPANIPAGSMRFASNVWSGSSGTFDIPIIANNILYFIVITYDPSSTTNVPKIYLNGISQTLTSSVAPVGTFTAKDSNMITMNIFQTGNIGTRTLNGAISDLCKWNRILSPLEVKQLYTDPWQIYSRPGLPNLVNTLSNVVSNALVGFRSLLGVGI